MNMFQKILYTITFIFITMVIGVVGYLYFAKNQPVLAAENIINATSCEQLDVQAAIDLANDGDSVNVPAGSCVDRYGYRSQY